MKLPRVALSLALLGAASASAAAGDWPEWRGPSGTGVATSSVPLTFSETENVAWVVPIEGRGFSTPIVHRGRIFLTTAVPTGDDESAAAPSEPEEGEGRRGRRGGAAAGPPDEHAFVVICLALEDGKELWRRTVRVDTPHEGFHRTYGSYASPSPATDGERLYVSFGSFGLYCLDLDGELVWEKDLGVRMRMRLQFGEGVAPALAGDLVVQLYDHEDDSFVVALDKKSGEELWRRPRDEPSVWAQPLPLEHGGVKQLVISGTSRVRAYTLAKGELLWECKGLGSNPIPVPLRHGDAVIVASGHRDPNLMSIALGGKGDVTSKSVRWNTNQACPYTASMVLAEGLLYVVTDRGFLSCYDAASGEAHYVEERLPRGSQLKSSPVAAGGRLYVPVESGAVHVVALGKEFEVLRTNEMGDRFFVASPAVANGRLLLRSAADLVCIAERSSGAGSGSPGR